MYTLIALLAAAVALAALGLSWKLWQRQKSLERRLHTAFEEQRNLALKIKDIEQAREAGEAAEIAADLYSPASVKQTGERQAQSKPAVPQKPQAEPEELDEEGSSLWQDVIFLAQQGVTADKIASDLNITRGEVDLILSLQNFKPDQTTD